MMLSAKLGVEPTERLNADHDLAIKRNTIVLVNATVAAPLIASISMRLFLKFPLVLAAYRQTSCRSVKQVTLGGRICPKCRVFQLPFRRIGVSVNVITARSRAAR